MFPAAAISCLSPRPTTCKRIFNCLKINTTSTGTTNAGVSVAYYFINVFQKIIDIIGSFLHTMRVVVVFFSHPLKRKRLRSRRAPRGAWANQVSSPQPLTVIKKIPNHLWNAAGSGVPEDSLVSILLSYHRLLSGTELRPV